METLDMLDDTKERNLSSRIYRLINKKNLYGCHSDIIWDNKRFPSLEKVYVLRGGHYYGAKRFDGSIDETRSILSGGIFFAVFDHRINRKTKSLKEKLNDTHYLNIGDQAGGEPLASSLAHTQTNKFFGPLHALVLEPSWRFPSC